MTNKNTWQIGCLIDGGLRNSAEGSCELIKIARFHGFTFEGAEWFESVRMGAEITVDQTEELEDLAQEAEEFLNGLDDLPPYTSFSWHDGDFGLWPNVESAIDDAEPVDSEVISVNHKSTRPEFCVDVNDHGNVTLYRLEYVEVWGCV